MKKKIIIIAAILLIAVLVWLLVSWLLRPSSLKSSSVVHQNIQHSSVQNDNVYFFSGSTFARLSDNTGVELTDYFNYPKVETVYWGEGFAVFQTFDITAADDLFKILFEDPYFINNIKGQHWWRIDFNTSNIKHLPVQNNGEITGAIIDDENIYFSEKNGNTTYLYGLNKRGGVTEEAKLEGDLRLVNKRGNMSLFKGSGVVGYNHATKTVFNIDAHIEGNPSIINEDLLLAVVNVGEYELHSANQEFNTVLININGEVIKTLSKQSNLYDYNEEMLAVATVSGEKIIFETYSFENGMANHMQTYTAPKIAENPINKIGLLSSDSFYVVDTADNLYFIDEDMEQTDDNLASLRYVCNDKYCAENTLGDTYMVRILSGNYKEARKAFIESVKRQGADPTMFDFKWRDATLF